MEIESRQLGQVIVFSPKGDLTDGQALIDQVSPYLDAELPRIVIDLSGVGMVSSSGLGVLVRLTAEVNTQQGRLVLADPSPFITSVLETTKLNSFFEIHRSVDAAVAAVS